jgi:hypothetical protein
MREWEMVVEGKVSLGSRTSARCGEFRQTYALPKRIELLRHPPQDDGGLPVASFASRVPSVAELDQPADFLQAIFETCIPAPHDCFMSVHSNQGWVDATVGPVLPRVGPTGYPHGGSRGGSFLTLCE